MLDTFYIFVYLLETKCFFNDSKKKPNFVISYFNAPN